MSNEPSGNIVFDTGTLLEFVSATNLGAYIKDLLQSGEVVAHTSEFHLGELQYLICRRMGDKESEETVKNLTQSGYLRIAPATDFMSQAANIKCKRALAFPDCFALAMGESMHTPVLFATRETELLKEMKKEPFKTKVLFLEDLVSASRKKVTREESRK